MKKRIIISSFELVFRAIGGRLGEYKTLDG